MSDSVLTSRTPSSHDFVSNSKFWFFKIFQNSRTSSDSLPWKKDWSQRTARFGYFENIKELSVCLKGLVVLWAGNLISSTTTDSGSMNILESENRQLLILKKIRIKESLVSGYFKNLKHPLIHMEGLAVVWVSNLISLIITSYGYLNISEIEDCQSCLFGGNSPESNNCQF